MSDSNSFYYKNLVLACSNNDIEQAKAYLDKKEDVNQDNGFPLILCCKRGYLDIIKLLLQYGADIHVRNNKALEIAKAEKHYEIVTYLENLLIKEKLTNI